MRVLRAALVALVLSVGLAAPVGAGQLEDAAAAYKRGDYETVLQLVRPLAEQGLAEFQVVLGSMYDAGQGVPQDDAEAARWYLTAADQGDATAQYLLGLMYDEGRGVRQDLILSHMWFSLAASKGARQATKGRDNVARWMTPAEIAEAQELAREWRPASER